MTNNSANTVANILPDIEQIISQLQNLLQSRELKKPTMPAMQQALLQDFMPSADTALTNTIPAMTTIPVAEVNNSAPKLDNLVSLPNSAGLIASIEDYELQDYQNPSLAKDMLEQVNSILHTDREAFLQIALKHQLNKEQAQGFYLDMAELLVKSLQDEAASVDVEAICTALWPQDTAKEIDIARRGANYVGIGDELDSTSLSFNPLVLKLAHAVGSFLTEDNYQGGLSGALPSSTGQAAYDEMLNLIATEAYQRNDPFTVKKVEHLSKRASLGV